MDNLYIINTSIPENVYPKRNEVDSLFCQRLRLMYNTDGKISRKFIDVIFHLAIKNNGKIPERLEIAEFIWQSKQCQCTDSIPKDHCIGIIDYLFSIKLLLNWPCNTIRAIYYYQIVEHKGNIAYPSREEYDNLITNILELSNNYDEYHDKNKIKIGVKLDKFLLTNTEENTICGLCHNDIKIGSKSYKIPCNHIFHSDKKQCLEETNIEQWFNENSKCPICRVDLKTICYFNETELISNVSELKIQNVPCSD
jgi:hypothetical protein